ncbi:MAG: hypothetical protein SGJ19_09285 [Planctomycetia bacterium]|nr:hypothetical protein [Planctomycetia bacterium]
MPRRLRKCHDRQTDLLGAGDSAINTAAYRWIATAGATTRIEPGKRLAIGADDFESPTLGTLLIRGGRLTVDTPVAWRLKGRLDFVVIMAATPTLDGSADLVVDNSGVISGDGRILVDVDNFGTISPGASAGLIEIDGEYRQEGTGRLVVELGGAAEDEYDRITINGEAILDGILDINRIDGFVPELGTSFRVIDSDGRRGAFATVIGGGFGQGRILFPHYSNSGVVLVATCAGDTDGDGDVDLEDLNNVRNNFGEQGSPILGDTNGDHLVNLEDLNAVRNNFGETAPQSPWIVPEPAAMALFVEAFLLVLALRGLARTPLSAAIRTQLQLGAYCKKP